MLGIELTDTRRRQRAAAAHRRLRQLHPGRERLPAGHHRHWRRRHPQHRRRHRRRKATSAAAIRSPRSARLAHRPRLPGRHRAQRGARSARSPTATSRSAWAIPANGDAEYDNELLDAALHRGRRPRQREYRPHRRPPRLPFRAQPAGRAHQGLSCSPTRRALAGGALSAEAVAFLNEWLAVDVAPSRQQSAASRLGRRAPVPGRQVRHRDAVPASRVRGIRAQDPAEHQRVPGARRLRHHDRSDDRRRVRARGLPLRPLHADRDDRPLRSDLQRRPHRPDRGLPQSAAFNGDQRASTTTSPPAPSSAA